MNPHTSNLKANAARLTELQQRVHETARDRAKSAGHLQAWQEACTRFRDAYDGLAFPGGLGRGLEKIVAGDLDTVVVALEYLENTPYCFRSQYVATYLRRALNKIDLPEPLAQRFLRWKVSKQRSRSAKQGVQRNRRGST